MFKHLLVPINGTDESDKAGKLARTLAKCCDAEVEYLYVVTNERVSKDEMSLVESEHMARIEQDMSARIDRDTAGGVMAVPGFAAQKSETPLRVRTLIGDKLLQNAKEEAEFEGITVTGTFVETGDPADVIVRVARELGADAIVMGSRGRSDFAGLLMGSISHSVAHHADCSVIAVK